MIEKWLPIVGYEGVYAVSSFGRVRREGLAKGAEVGLIMKHQLNDKGYPQVKLSRNNNKKLCCIHRLVSIAFIGVVPPNKFVNHKDGNKTNNYVTNLEYVTSSENQLHARRIGLNKSHGINHFKAKLSNSQIDEIRRIFSIGDTSPKSLACTFEVQQGYMYKILNNKVRKNRWKE